MKPYLGGVAWRQIEVAYYDSMLQLVAHLILANIPFRTGTVIGDALISRARSIAATTFLGTDCDVLLSIDTDIAFDHRDAVRLCRLALERGIAGAAYLTRSNKQPAIMLGDEAVEFRDGVEPVRVRFLSTGFMAVRRDVFEALRETLPLCHKGKPNAFYPFYMPFVLPWPHDDEENLYLSEDWAFIERARRAGFDAWLDPTIRLGHVGTAALELEDVFRPPRPERQPLRMERLPNGHVKTFTLEAAGV